MRKIPKGAIKVRLPAVQQRDDYSCGAATFMSIAARYGVGPDSLEQFKQKLGTNSQFGTHFSDIERFAAELGLNPRVHIGMRRRHLKRCLDKKVPVVVNLQAHSSVTSTYRDQTRNSDGHYVACVGYDADNYFYFMDPSIGGTLVFLPWKALKARWRDDQGRGKPEVYHRLGIAIGAGRHNRTRALATFMG